MDVMLHVCLKKTQPTQFANAQYSYAVATDFCEKNNGQHSVH